MSTTTTTPSANRRYAWPADSQPESDGCFTGHPGTPGFRTSTDVRRNSYRVVIISPELGMSYVVATTTPAAAGKVKRYLQRVERNAITGIEHGNGIAIIVPSKHYYVSRVWVMPLGNLTRERAEERLRVNEGRIEMALRGLGCAGRTRRIIRTSDQIEAELGINGCRGEWRALCRTKQSGRMSSGLALVALHPELMTLITTLDCSIDEAVDHIQNFLRTDTTMRGKKRDIEAYLAVTWQAAQAARSAASNVSLRLLQGRVR
jgi:hypothetical protein